MARWGELAMLVDAKRIIDLESTVKELAKALAFYAEGEHYARPDAGPSEIERDEGDKARATLRKLGEMS